MKILYELFDVAAGGGEQRDQNILLTIHTQKKNKQKLQYKMLKQIHKLVQLRNLQFHLLLSQIDKKKTRKERKDIKIS